MATRKIIRIDEDLCNGCGDCVVGCAEGALKIVAGKAKLVREDFCDGFGDCIGTCPTGALVIEERDCDDYDHAAVREHVATTRGEAGLAAFVSAAARHGSRPEDATNILEPLLSPGVSSKGPEASSPQSSPSRGGQCPGSQMRVLPRTGDGFLPPIPHPSAGTGEDPNPPVIRPELTQWPIQLHLINPAAPFLKDRELAVLATCAPVAMPDSNWRYVRGRAIALACPKLDRTEPYVDKLTAILREPSIPRAVVVRMEVPCCSGLTAMVMDAAARTGRDDLEVVEETIGLQGELKKRQVVRARR
jgi:NAD-dependent dihydropyrimidine dehydrogenase PreA subunit